MVNVAKPMDPMSQMYRMPRPIFQSKYGIEMVGTDTNRNDVNLSHHSTPMSTMPSGAPLSFSATDCSMNTYNPLYPVCSSLHSEFSPTSAEIAVGMRPNHTMDAASVNYASNMHHPPLQTESACYQIKDVRRPNDVRSRYFTPSMSTTRDKRCEMNPQQQLSQQLNPDIIATTKPMVRGDSTWQHVKSDALGSLKICASCNGVQAWHSHTELPYCQCAMLPQNAEPGSWVNVAGRQVDPRHQVEPHYDQVLVDWRKLPSSRLMPPHHEAHEYMMPAHYSVRPHIYHPKQAASGSGGGRIQCFVQTFECGYCGYRKKSRPGASDGMVRIRCPLVGHVKMGC